MLTNLLLNSVLHHVSLSWIIEINQELEYDTYEKNTDWLTNGPCYNISICTKLHGTVFAK